MTQEPSKKEIDEMITVLANFKFLAAGTMLKKIPNHVPLQVQTKRHFEMEISIESFLFFIISAIDIVFAGINKKMSLNIPSTSVTSKRLVRELKKKKSQKSKIIISELQKYCKAPQHRSTPTTKKTANEYSRKYLNGSLGLDFWSIFENRKGRWFRHTWDRSNSSVWELRRLRNQITHSSLLYQSGDRGTVKSRDAITLHLVNEASKPHEMYFIYNPKKYFSISFADSVNLSHGIGKCLENESKYN